MPRLSERLRHWLDNPPGSDDIPQFANRCPKCEWGVADGAVSCARCGHDQAEPFRISAEQKEAAYFEGCCVSCQRRRRWWSRAWDHCGWCAAPHCRSCWKLTYSYDRHLRDPDVSRWLCLYCRQWNEEEHEYHYGGGGDGGGGE